ncbi:MAG: prolipoprotein diacylglyceryl transferase [Gammaproteobacteria bacterium]|nr:MAG: prolipoprotein diacylglyceryl transferase [Gammaproteobacteria bacterium]
MLVYPDIDPVAIQVGPIKVHWYGLMYLIGLAAAWGLGRLRAKRESSGWRSEEISDLIFYAAVGIILGGRCGYILFYNFSAFVQDPAMLFRIWEGGMSFHGGLLGVIVAMWCYARKTRRHFFQVSDFVAPLVPIGLGAGRIGNFINGELVGRVASPDLPWAMVYPYVDQLPRHPSQLYQAFTDGALLFVLLWWFASRPRPIGSISSLFLLGYGCMRFFTEFFRTPDSQIGFVAFDWMTMGQALSLPMVMVGGIGMVLSYQWATRQGKTT